MRRTEIRHAASSDRVGIRKIIGGGSTKEVIDEDGYPTRAVGEWVGKGLAPGKGRDVSCAWEEVRKTVPPGRVVL